MEIVEINWIKYKNFFDLWRMHKRDTQLLYVIGDQHHCYVGSIGVRGGLQGLGTRYQWQYVHRARSIFGLEESVGQVAYAGLFVSPSRINSRLILASESFVQHRCIIVLGPQVALFETEEMVSGVQIISLGHPPAFLI